MLITQLEVFIHNMLFRLIHQRLFKDLIFLKNYIFTVQNLYSTSTDMNTNSLFINKHPRPGVSGSDSNMSLYGFWTWY